MTDSNVQPVPDFESTVDVNWQPWPGNAEGTARFTRPTMCKFILEDGDLPEMRALASDVLEKAGWPSTDRGKVEALTAHVRKVCHYIPDQPYRETCVRPRFLFCLPGAKTKACIKIGDCSNMNCALGALCRSAGFDVKVQGIDYGSGIQPHVNIIVCLRDEGGKWAEADATTTKPVGFVSPGKKDVLDPHDPKVTGAAAKQGAFIGAAGAFVGAGKAWDALPMHGYASAIFAQRDVGAGAPPATFTCASKFEMTVSGTGPNTPSLPSGFTVTSATNQGTINGATVWALEGTYNGPPMSPVSFDNIYYGTNYPWTVVTASVTPPLVPMMWNGSTCVTDPGGHTPCPPGTSWDGSRCIQPIVLQAPPPPPPQQHTGGQQQQQQSSTGLSTGAKVGLIAGGALLLGGGAFAAYKAGWFGRAA
jgi:hypothetical protein